MSKLEWLPLNDTDPWLRVGDRGQTGSFLGSLEGKYLFFSDDQELLIRTIEDEILNHGFKDAKVIAEPRGKDYVACLYWHSPDRKHELAERHGNTPNLKYRYWKSNADTRAGKYSAQHMGIVMPCYGSIIKDNKGGNHANKENN